MSTLQMLPTQYRRMPYGTTTTPVLVEDEPEDGPFEYTAVRRQNMLRRARPDWASRLSTGITMPYEPTDELLASPETITSATPAPLPKVAEAIEKTVDDVEARPWRGVYALEFPEEVIFTKQIDIRPEQLEEWQPQGVISERQVRNEDE